MERDEKALWNRKYSEGSHSSWEPDPFLVRAYSEFLAGASQATLSMSLAEWGGTHCGWQKEAGE